MDQVPAPFGTYALSPWREMLRRSAAATPNGRLGLWMVSILRRASLLGHANAMRGPHDVNVAQGVNARLYPGTNRCEKRAFAGVHLWDLDERASLEKSLKAHSNDRPYVFLDVGANVGLYSLFVNAAAASSQTSCQIIAIEPDTENRNRLTFNCNASNCELIVEPIGIAHLDSIGFLTEAKSNRGTVSVAYTGPGVEVELQTLARLIKRHQLSHVDAMKIDIEGRDASSLRALIEQAPKKVWPRLMIIEIYNRSENPILDYLKQHGYQLQKRTKTNAILEFDENKAGVMGSA